MDITPSPANDLIDPPCSPILEALIAEGEASGPFIDATPQYFENRHARLQAEYRTRKDDRSGPTSPNHG
jgi:hypothetical protein